MAQTLRKQPSESWLYDMDFAPRLADADVIASVISIAQQEYNTDTGALSSTTDLTFSSQAFSGQKVQVRISGGTHGKTYLITFKVTTSAGNSAEAEGFLQTLDLPQAA
jgi:hypothetical protein